jgi:hypothetical protein
VLTDDGKVVRGMLVREDNEYLALRDARDLQSEIKIDKNVIESRTTENVSMMPSGLVSTLQTDRNFLDLVSYLLEIKRGGQSRANELMPSPKQLAGMDDTKDIDHDEISKRAKKFIKSTASTATAKMAILPHWRQHAHSASRS